MPGLTDAKLDKIAAKVAKVLFKDVGTVYRRVYEQDESGGYGPDDFTAVFTDEPCAVLDAGVRPQREQIVGQQVTNELEKLIVFKRGLSIRHNDEIVSSGVRYRVIMPKDPTSFEVIRRVPVVQISYDQ